LITGYGSEMTLLIERTIPRKPIPSATSRSRFPSYSRNLRDILELDGHRISAAGNASEALARKVILRPDRSIVYFSPFAERITSYSADEVYGRDFVNLLIPEAQRPADEELMRVMAGCPTPGFENHVLCRDGSRRWMAWNARVLPDYEGGPAILEVGHEITFLKLAQERALQAERPAAIGEVVAGLAHESRNALQRSQACLEMLALAVHHRPEVLDLINRIQKSQNHLHHLYED